MNITKLEKAPEGHWTARVAGVPVTRVFGSWTTVPNKDGSFRDLNPAVAARLQQRVRPIENAERRQAVAA